jgi:hypothetical protein
MSASSFSNATTNQSTISAPRGGTPGLSAEVDGSSINSLAQTTGTTGSIITSLQDLCELLYVIDKQIKEEGITEEQKNLILSEIPQAFIKSDPSNRNYLRRCKEHLHKLPLRDMVHLDADTEATLSVLSNDSIETVWELRRVYYVSGSTFFPKMEGPKDTQIEALTTVPIKAFTVPARD